VLLIKYLLLIEKGLQIRGNNNDFSTTYGPRRFENAEEKYLSSLLPSVVEVNEERGKSLKSTKKIMQERVFLTA
jgi:hypothetical protein